MMCVHYMFITVSAVETEQVAAFHVAPAMQQPKSATQYTASDVDINNTRYSERIQSLIHIHLQHVRSESAREQRIAPYKSDQ